MSEAHHYPPDGCRAGMSLKAKNGGAPLCLKNRGVLVLTDSRIPWPATVMIPGAYAA